MGYAAGHRCRHALNAGNPTGRSIADSGAIAPAAFRFGSVLNYIDVGERIVALGIVGGRLRRWVSAGAIKAWA